MGDHVGLNRSKRWGKWVAKLIGDEQTLEKTWDCTISVGGQTIRAHKWILAAQSPVLRQLIAGQKGGSKPTITIPSKFPMEAVKAVFRFCYYGYIDEATLKGDGAEAIFELAHSLGMGDLKGFVEESLAKSVNEENIARRVRLADKHSTVKLMTACVSCIVLNKSCPDSEEWVALEKEKPGLTNKFLKSVVQWDGPPYEFPFTPEYKLRSDMMVVRNKNIAQLYNDIDTADVVIQVGEETLRAHKIFLMTFSPIFLKMFTDPSSLEARTGVVASPDSMRELVRYCYQGGVPTWKMDRVGLELSVFELADKYCIHGLKDGLEKGFIDGLRMDNWKEKDALANTHSASRLKIAIFDLRFNALTMDYEVTG